MKEGNMMSYEMYEDFKETMVKTIKTELSAKHNQSTDTNLPQRIEQIVHTEQETIGTHRTEQRKNTGWYRQSASSCRSNRNSSRTAAENRVPQNIARYRIERSILGDDRHDVDNRSAVYDVVLGCQTELRPHRQ